MNTVERKSEIRRRMGEGRRGLTPENRETASGLLCRRLISLPLWTTARCLAAFWPLGKEPEISPLLRVWIEKGKGLVLPRVEGPRPQDIELYRIADPGSDLVAGTLGILEPDPSRCAVAQPESLDWIWVPGVAFDLDCYRLGRGRAYYDSLLSVIPREIHRTGIGYDWQIVEEPLPRDAWDQALNSVVTDVRVIVPLGVDD